MKDSDGSLTGKTVLITGGARRVGATIARTLHGAGANVVVHYRNSAPDAEKLKAELNGARASSAATFQCDLLDMDKLSELSGYAVGRFGSLDILVTTPRRFIPRRWARSPRRISMT